MSRLFYCYRHLLHSVVVVFPACTGFQAVTDVTAEKDRKVTREARETLGLGDLLVQMEKMVLKESLMYGANQVQKESVQKV